MIPSAKEYMLINPQKPNKTYYLNQDAGQITGYIHKGIDAVKQAVYLILNTERYQYAVYSWNYGIELKDLIGQPKPFVESEIKRRVYEALTQDDRITGVDNFQFEDLRNTMRVTFEVLAVPGKFDYEMEVMLDV